MYIWVNMGNKKRETAQVFFAIFLVIGGGVIGATLVPPEVLEVEKIVYLDKIIEVEKTVEVEKTIYTTIKEFKDVNELSNWLSSDNTDKQQYVAETHDCDDFAIDLVRAARADGYEIFICATTDHMFNMCHIDGIWYLIEPQTDGVSIHGDEL